ncbi:C1 family peptidase [Sporomusa acidovorans]|uniref:Peptidase C1A papain C-terminal domain-containing protein n=1 Tax=Sporomusa acidovorans (strain ATCC 49682 / DSM 3132 / Mol) TaxID=1123286 RepID=A0ABZ3IYS4_SPOA4|nr:hypothetical protein [Sporomusa acidovorans]OZC17665.1 hypothetical protein SPACI_36690 [Sporomusa acidovorans DSM 3132]SDE11416.1 hypothetical protein SAMN04488499_100843 [Sporomusa acidovorans]
MNLRVILPDNRRLGTGWRPPLPDLRDYDEAHPKLAVALQKLGIDDTVPLPQQVDLRQWCSPVQDQGELGACTAHAAVGIIEYFENRSYSRSITASRLFIYKNARNLQGVTGDQGTYIRDTMGALALCGVPPEKYWPYTDKAPAFDREPASFVYAVTTTMRLCSIFATTRPAALKPRRKCWQA